MIEYRDTLEGLTEADLVGFFAGWPSPPSARTHLRMLHRSAAVVVAVDARHGRVIGFVSALSDGVLSAYIPLLEVLPDYRGHGVGSELMRRMLVRLEHAYMVDLACDPELEPFYARFGMTRRSAMVLRHYACQAGREPDTRGHGRGMDGTGPALPSRLPPRDRP